MLLDGDWRFELDPDDKGLREKWHIAHAYTQTSIWPASVESHLAAAKDVEPTSPRPSDEIIAWYERELTVPEDWSTECGCEVQLTFGACGYETRVWLNGHALKTVEGEEVHFGEYTSFSYELPPALLEPINRVTVRVADSGDPEIPRGKQASRVYKRGGIWYQTISGAVRSIWIEPVERNRLRSRLWVTSTIECSIVEIDLVLRVKDPGMYKLRIVVASTASSDPAVIRELEFALLALETGVIIHIMGSLSLGRRG